MAIRFGNIFDLRRINGIKMIKRRRKKDKDRKSSVLGVILMGENQSTKVVEWNGGSETNN